MNIVAALYKFSLIESPHILQSKIRRKLKSLSILGTILVGKEGLNGTISGKKENIDKAIKYIKNIDGFCDVDVKFSKSLVNPFIRLKIKLKDEIVTIGDKSINPNKEVGKYVNPEEWNDLISNKNTILIDTRNNYEHSIGTFKNSLNPNTIKFREFPEWVKKNEVPFSVNSKVKKDLNTADAQMLQSVSGIGSKLSARIVKYRTYLGGFSEMNQCYEVFGLDSLVVQKLMKQLTNTKSLRTIKIFLIYF